MQMIALKCKELKVVFLEKIRLILNNHYMNDETVMFLSFYFMQNIFQLMK